jgi:hypothetical protein
LANRSAALLKLGLWSECEQDIATALLLGYPKERQAKLAARRKECEKRSKESLIQLKPCPNGLEEEAEREQVIDWDSEAKRWIARQKVNKASIVWTEKAIVSLLIESNNSFRCAFCIKILPQNPFPCHKCSYYRYCDRDCSINNWNAGHRFDCCRSNWLRSIGFKHLDFVRLAVRLCLRWTACTKELDEQLSELSSQIHETDLDAVEQFEPLAQLINAECTGNWAEIQRRLQMCFAIVKKNAHSTFHRFVSSVSLQVGGLLQQITLIRNIEQQPLATGLFLRWSLVTTGDKCEQPNCHIQDFVQSTITVSSIRDIEPNQALEGKSAEPCDMTSYTDQDSEQVKQTIQSLKKELKSGQLALYSPQCNFRSAEHLLLKCQTTLGDVLQTNDKRMIDLTLNLSICYVGLRTMDRAVNQLLRAHDALHSMERDSSADIEQLTLLYKSVSVTLAVLQWSEKANKPLSEYEQFKQTLQNQLNQIDRLNTRLTVSEDESQSVRVLLNQCRLSVQ